MSVRLYQFREHNLMVEGERDDLVDLADRLRDAEGTLGDLAFKIDKELCGIDNMINIANLHGFSIEEYREHDVLCGYEMETWTGGGVNMIHFIDLRGKEVTHETFLEGLKQVCSEFSVDDAVDLHRQDEEYRADFTVRESLEDFEIYAGTLKEMVNHCCASLDYHKKKAEKSEIQTSLGTLYAQAVEDEDYPAIKVFLRSEHGDVLLASLECCEYTSSTSLMKSPFLRMISYPNVKVDEPEIQLFDLEDDDSEL